MWNSMILRSSIMYFIQHLLHYDILHNVNVLYSSLHTIYRIQQNQATWNYWTKARIMHIFFQQRKLKASTNHEFRLCLSMYMFSKTAICRPYYRNYNVHNTNRRCMCFIVPCARDNYDRKCCFNWFICARSYSLAHRHQRWHLYQIKNDRNKPFSKIILLKVQHNLLTRKAHYFCMISSKICLERRTEICNTVIKNLDVLGWNEHEKYWLAIDTLEAFIKISMSIIDLNYVYRSLLNENWKRPQIMNFACVDLCICSQRQPFVAHITVITMSIIRVDDVCVLLSHVQEIIMIESAASIGLFVRGVIH